MKRLAVVLAWRNVSRNKRRSGIAAAAVAFAVFFSVTLRSLQLGVYGHMITTVVGGVLGYVEVQQEGYWPLQNMDQSMPEDLEWLSRVRAHDEVAKAAPRLSGFTWISSTQGGSVAQLVGADWEAEGIAEWNKRLVSGSLSPEPNGIWLGEGLAKMLRVKLHDTVVALSQGYQGALANDVFPVAGILVFGNPELDKRIAVVSLPEAQSFFGAYGQWTGVVLTPKNPTKHKRMAQEVSKSLPKKGAVWQTWEERMPELDQAIEADSTGGIVVLFVLYVVIGFGLLGTMIMMAEERRREFSIQIALGVKRKLLALIVVLEAAFLALLGSLAGGGIARLLVEYMHRHPLRLQGELAHAIEEQGWAPVLPPSMDPAIAWTHIGIILALTLALSLWPVRVIYTSPTVYRG